MNHALRAVNGRWTGVLRRLGVALGMVGVMLAMAAGTASAAEVAGGDAYHLPRGEVIADDLYVGGGEVIIDGTVNGDLVVAGGYVEVNGVVTGDLIAAGGAVVLTGAVQDDVRLAGGAILVSGSVGDDLFVAGGGGWPGAIALPVTIGNRSLPQGVQVMPGASIGGDAYVVGGQGTVAGSVGGDLFVGMENAVFSGHVAGNATLTAQSVTVGDGAQVQGVLTVSARSSSPVPEGVAATVRTEAFPVNDATAKASPNLVVRGLWWLLRTALLLIGLAATGWLVWKLAPRAIERPAATMEEHPMIAALYGLVAAVAVLPVSAALVFLAALFWNWFPGGVVMAAFTFGLSALVWLLSPVVTGLWLGRKLAAATGWVHGDLPSLLLGVAVIVIVGRVISLVPCVGGLTFGAIYLVSFALAVGGLLLARQRPVTPVAQG